MTPLIDATEMYLRTVYELEEEGITPIRARLVERLGLSAPAVSETVSRLEGEGLMTMAADRTLSLTQRGRALAVSVMRKHRLAERLLTDVIGLDWESAHTEACRWEHVISDAAEARIAVVLGEPAESPYGNPIPAGVAPPAVDAPTTLAQAAKDGLRVRIRRISEALQVDTDALRFLDEAGLRPGAEVTADVSDGAVVVRVAEEPIEVAPEIGDLVYVTPA